MTLAEPTTAAEVRQRYRETRERLWSPPCLKKPQEVAKRTPITPPISFLWSAPDGCWPSMERAPTLAELAEEIAARHGLTVNDLKSGTRNASVVAVRHNFFYRAAVETLKTYRQIGMFCGGRDHSTVMHGISAHCRRNDMAPPRGLHLIK